MPSERRVCLAWTRVLVPSLPSTGIARGSNASGELFGSKSWIRSSLKKPPRVNCHDPELKVMGAGDACALRLPSPATDRKGMLPATNTNLGIDLVIAIVPRGIGNAQCGPRGSG